MWSEQQGLHGSFQHRRRPQRSRSQRKPRAKARAAVASGSSLESCSALTPSAQYMVVLVLQFIWRQRGSKPCGTGLRVSMTQQRSRHLQALQVRLWSLELPPTRARAETIPCRCTLASSTAPTCMPHPASHPDPESSAEGADVMCSHAPSQVALAAASARRLRATHRTVETPAHGAVGLN